jgi:transposase
LATTDGKKYDTRLYDPIGLQLIIFESRQPKAIQFKVAVAHLVCAYAKGDLKPSKWSLKDDLVSASRQILSLGQGYKRAALVRDLAERDGVSIQTAYRRIERATGERLKTTNGTVIKRKTAGFTKYPTEKAEVLAYAKTNPEAQGAQIKAVLGLPLHRNQICRWLREARK